MFTLESTDGRARAGTLSSGHGKLQTPFFMPVATKGAVKDLTPEELHACNIRCFISNGFLLSLKPGVDVIAAHGGLHSFMHWDRGIFTDSGGFQILLDSFLIKKTENGIVFRNPYAGIKSLFTPEDSIQMQHIIGSDVAMAFDDVARYGVTKAEARKSLVRTHEWLDRCIIAHKKNAYKTNKKQMLFGIAQGGVYDDLRKESAEHLLTCDIDGFAIGGLAIGEPPEKMFHAIAIQTDIFEKKPTKPRYVMGLGSPIHLVDAVALGADMFDSIFPTQNARRHSLFTKTGVLRITNAAYKEDLLPIEKECTCYTCTHFSRSYLHHMMRLKERIGFKLASIHNIHFVQNLLDECRSAIINGTFEQFRKEFKERYVH